jgi:hypothetical protein
MGGLKQLKGGHQARVHSNQMVLVMTRHRDWTRLTAAKDAQGRVVKQLQGAKGPTKNMHSDSLLKSQLAAGTT